MTPETLQRETEILLSHFPWLTMRDLADWQAERDTTQREAQGDPPTRQP